MASCSSSVTVSGFRVQGFGVQGSGFRVEGHRIGALPARLKRTRVSRRTASDLHSRISAQPGRGKFRRKIVTGPEMPAEPETTCCHYEQGGGG
jgi:hypothetical protein